MATRAVFVTGGNAGIGLALCAQLAAEDGCHVFMGSRSVERGTAALATIKEKHSEASVEVVQCNVADAASVQRAAAQVGERLGESGKLYGVVNNAGAGLQHGVTDDEVLDTNLLGPKRVVDAFLPLLARDGRIVNMGSGAGPMFVDKCADVAVKRQLCLLDSTTWADLESLAARRPQGGMGAYGLSKACLMVYTHQLSRAHPELTVTCCSPGFIDTAMTRGYGAQKTPEEGTVSARHCLFRAPQEHSGFFFGSDALRSPLHYMRNPPAPEYDGTPPEF